VTGGAGSAKAGKRDAWRAAERTNKSAVEEEVKEEGGEEDKRAI
jgi:hypothetical protein